MKNSTKIELQGICQQIQLLAYDVLAIAKDKELADNADLKELAEKTCGAARSAYTLAKYKANDEETAKRLATCYSKLLYKFDL